ncbi:MAG TPA: VanZ family protein [Candidatus Acidoferrales bacterium]|nr:VanZ family protein [Candidatus Acidoferrales bacterium]
MKRWTIVAAIVAVGFFAMALSGAVYEFTSPYELTWHVALRKAYSIVAFTIVGFLYVKVTQEWRNRTPSLVHTTIAIALYSAIIEVGQYYAGSREGIKSNLFDIFCGGVGGALGSIIARGTEKKA